MAGLGEAASVAGLIALAGSTFQAVCNVYAFCKSYQSVQPKLQGVMEELGRLKETLSQVQRVASQAATPSSGSLNTIAALQNNICECRASLEDLEGLVQQSQRRGRGTLFRIAKVAANPDHFAAIYRQLSSHRQNLTIKLGLLACDLGSHIYQEFQRSTQSMAKLQEVQSKAASDSEVRMTSIENTVSDSRSDIESFSQSLQAKLSHLSTNLAVNADMTSKQIDVLEARMLAMQLQLISSIEASGNTRKPGPGPGTKRRWKAHRVSTNARKMELTATTVAHWCSVPVPTAEYSVRLVKPALLIHDKGGVLCREVTTLADDDFEKLNLMQKTAIIQYLQGLRLLLWLLRKDNYLTSSQRKAIAGSRSALTAQASITSLWEYCNSFAELDNVLRSHSLDGPGLLPWLRCKQWLQYLFDRVPDKDQEGERLMELVLTQWAAFPRPDRGEVDSYVLPIPHRLLTESQKPCPCPLHMNGEHGSPKTLAASEKGANSDTVVESTIGRVLGKLADSKPFVSFMYCCVNCSTLCDGRSFVGTSLQANMICSSCHRRGYARYDLV